MTNACIVIVAGGEEVVVTCVRCDALVLVMCLDRKIAEGPQLEMLTKSVFETLLFQFGSLRKALLNPLALDSLCGKV